MIEPEFRNLRQRSSDLNLEPKTAFSFLILKVFVFLALIWIWTTEPGLAICSLDLGFFENCRQMITAGYGHQLWTHKDQHTCVVQPRWRSCPNISQSILHKILYFASVGFIFFYPLTSYRHSIPVVYYLLLDLQSVTPPPPIQPTPQIVKHI